MKKIKISHELIARFVEGNTTAIETEMILRAAQKSSELRDHINFLFSIAADDDDHIWSKPAPQRLFPWALFPCGVWLLRTSPSIRI